VTATPVLEVDDLSVEFAVRQGTFKPKARLRAVNRVSFGIDGSETLGLVGESGSGKSTTARGLLQLVPVTTGSVRLLGEDLVGVSGRQLRERRRRIQMVFQDPYSSLDPSMTVGTSVSEPLIIHTDLTASQRTDRVRELFELVGLSDRHIERYPYEFSGGQRQRVAIARALALDPEVVLCDEAVSALDVSTQNQVIELLQRLQDELGTALLFIAHDLGVVRHIAHRTAVMYLGRIVESGPTDRLFDAPAHPYTQALLSAVPVPNPRRQKGRRRILLSGDPPSPLNPPSGCEFHTRCPHVMDVCRAVQPEATPVDGGGEVTCHLQTSGPTLAGAPVTQLALPARG
jgi:peptide/nickel transport system ATP-binding protein